MNDKLTFAAILLGGYLLGRTKKLKMALAVAGVLGARELKAHPDLLKAGTAALSTPAVKKLTDELSGRLVEAGKTAVVAAATKRVDGLVSNLEQRMGSPLASGGGRDQGGPAGDTEEPVDEATDESPLEDETEEETEQEGTPSEGEEPETEEPEDEQPQDEDEEPAAKAAPRRRRTASGSSSGTSGQGRSKQGTSAGGAKKSTGTRSTSRSTSGKTTKKPGSR